MSDSPNRYAKFRTWLVLQILSGASPSRVSRFLKVYAARFSASPPLSHVDQTPEIPTEREINDLARSETWAESAMKKSQRPARIGPL